MVTRLTGLRMIVTPVCLTVAVLLLPMLAAAPAHAQATRTWVSGVGDDANPCSRTAPCKTFAGAISKTAAGGEINCLDPGGFGALTITKAIAIICQVGTAGVLVSGTNGITVAAGTSDKVYLQGLDFEGLGSGLNGIQFTSGLSLYIKDCIVRGFTNFGINIANNNVNAFVVVDNTVIADNGTLSSGGGIQVDPSGFSANVLVTRTQIAHNKAGIRAQDNSKVTVTNSSVSGNTATGFNAVSTSSPVEINVTDSVATNNGIGVSTNGAGATIRLNRDVITDNGTGINAGGTVISTSPATNFNAGNTTPGAPNGTPVTLQ